MSNITTGSHAVGIERTRLRTAEADAIKAIAAAATLVGDVTPKIEKRMALAGIDKSDVKSIEHRLLWMLGRLADTVPPAQLISIRKNLEALRVSVKIADAAPDDSYTYIANGTLGALCETVFSDTCGLCVKSAADARLCPVRKALDACVYGDNLTMRDGCCYRTLNDLHDWGCDNGPD